MTIRSKYFGSLALWLPLAAPVARAETSEAEQSQAALESWVLERAPAEKITGVAAYISVGDPGPAIEAFAGKTGRDSQDPPGAADHVVPGGQHIEILRRRRDPETLGGGKALARRPAQKMAPRVSGLEGRQHPTPA
jgi:hypothetical protein